MYRRHTHKQVSTFYLTHTPPLPSFTNFTGDWPMSAQLRPFSGTSLSPKLTDYISPSPTAHTCRSSEVEAAGQPPSWRRHIAAENGERGA
ncbi:hypothetical protein Hdeb2414_s0079g00778811 [Helianthus debilis subsp. tardiflorus]